MKERRAALSEELKILERPVHALKSGKLPYKVTSVEEAIDKAKAMCLEHEIRKEQGKYIVLFSVNFNSKNNFVIIE